ncbi:MAG: 16S rRNA (guanine(527)-N(7))-methyltransferase RsmG [Alphaproteobacteria bacterium]|nr:16S rRNA (guanine(527)-N(7))-methyltransferase RsmG [Alphaproteobacteria bacterium]
MTPEEFGAATGVSRETLDRLRLYASLLARWQRAVNLIGKSTAADIWERHFLDSAQLYPYLAEGPGLVDFGSGAGFPGAVLATLGVKDVHLVESDSRKCAFLRELDRQLGLGMTIHESRIDHLTPWKARSLTARALAPLSQLLDMAEEFLSPDTVCLFLKGESVDRELTEAEKGWNMTASRLPSRTSPTGVILRLTRVERKK